MRWTNCRISLVAPVTAFLFPHLFFFNNDMKRNPLYDIISCFNMDVSTFQKALNSYRIPSTVIGSFLNWNWNVLDPICWLICPECCKFQFNLNEMGNKVTAFQSSSSENCQLKFKLPFAYQQQRNVYGWSVTNKSRAMKLNIWQFNRSWKQIYSKWQKKKLSAGMTAYGHSLRSWKFQIDHLFALLTGSSEMLFETFSYYNYSAAGIFPITQRTLSTAALRNF